MYDMDLPATESVIKDLKALKDELGLSLKDIEALVQERGEFVPPRSVQRLFADGSETETGFSYERTLRPIAKAMMAAREAKKGGPSAAEISLLKSMLYLKAEEIDALREQLDAARAENTRLTAIIVSQVETKDRRMDERDALINKLLEKALK